MKKVFPIFSFALLGFSLYLIFFCSAEEKQMQIKPVSVSAPAAFAHPQKSPNSKAEEPRKEEQESVALPNGIR